MSTEIFELDLQGGAAERLFRARRPHADAMPWDSLDTSAFGDEEIALAQRSWTDLAIQEYGAAASQSNALRLLVRARAPLDLSAMLTTFPLDELAHTELCVRMAETLGGVPPVAYPIERVFPDPQSSSESSVLEAARAVAWEFCVGETLSHGLLVSHMRHARKPLLEAVWGRLAKDEAVHARFGWLCLEWLETVLRAEERKVLSRTIELAIQHVDELDAKVESLPDAAFSEISVFGSRGREAYLAETRTVLERDVVRRLHAFVR